MWIVHGSRNFAVRLFLIFGLSSIASAVLDLVSRVGTQVGTPTPTLHARRHTCGDPGPDARDIRCYSSLSQMCAAASTEHRETGSMVCSLSPLTLNFTD